jgi:hypothetical protein
MAGEDLVMTSAGLGMLGLAAGFLVVLIVVLIALYIYSALALMTIAKRINVEPAWLAWIPIANIYLMTKMAGVPWWTMLVILVSWIPLIGPLAMAAAMVWWFWKISEKRGKDGWWGILMIIPIANLVIMGILAWGKD